MREKIQDHTTSLEHVSTKKMLADPLAKGLAPNMFRLQRTLSRHGFTGKPMDNKGLVENLFQR